MTGYFAPTSRFGGPDDFRAFVDRLHEAVKDDEKFRPERFQQALAGLQPFLRRT